MVKSFINKVSSIVSEADTAVLLFCFFVFSLPFWRRLEFFTPYSLLDGRFIDYLTYSIFVFDIILSGVLLFWVVRALLSKVEIFFFNWKVSVSFTSLLLFSLVSFSFSTFRPISLYYTFSLLVLFALLLFVYNVIKTKKDIFLVFNFFILSMFFQSLLAIVQFFKNQSIGLSFLGEQLVSPRLAGVAKIVIDGENHIRPYGTFSHPNILALFLVVALLLAAHLFVQYKEKLYRVFLTIISISLLLAIFLTFSRIIWATTAVSLVYIFFKEKKGKISLKSTFNKKRGIIFLLILICVIAGFLIYFSPSIWWRINPLTPTTWDSLKDRMVVIEKSFTLIKDSPFFGIGIGNFVIEIAYLLTGYPVWMAEPVHNTYILILTEIGIFGLISYLFMLYYTYKESLRAPYYIKHIFWVFLVYMFFDHCFWDIRQVMYLFFIFLGLFLVMGRKYKI